MSVTVSDAVIDFAGNSLTATLSASGCSVADASLISVTDALGLQSYDIGTPTISGTTLTVPLSSGVVVRLVDTTLAVGAGAILDSGSVACAAASLLATNKSQVTPCFIDVGTVKAMPNLRSMIDNSLLTDRAIGGYIQSISDAAERYCNRAFFAATYTELLDGEGSDELVLRHFPVLSVTSLTVTMLDGTVLDTIDVDDDLLMKQESGFIWFNRRSTTTPLLSFPTGRQNITVVYRAGFVVLPAAIQQAVAEWVAEVCLRTTRDPALVAETIKGYSWRAREQSFPHAGQSLPVLLSEPPPNVKMLLSSYRNIRP